MKLYTCLLAALLFSVITQPATARDGFDLGIIAKGNSTHTKPGTSENDITFRKPLLPKCATHDNSSYLR